MKQFTNKAQILLLKDFRKSMLIDMDNDPTSLAGIMLLGGEYASQNEIEVEHSGWQGAEEMFDLTNNPARHEERVQKYGRQRSLSVGDIVKVNHEMFLCCGDGWKQIDVTKAAKMTRC